MAAQFLNFAVLLVLGAFVSTTFADEPERIVGGNNANQGEFPYQVSLRNYGYHFCGGTLISDRHVVTAAHCVNDLSAPYNAITVVTGTISTNSGGESHRIAKIAVHREYIHSDVNSYKHDIALITLAAPYRRTAYQSPIALATVDPPEKTPLMLSGWGNVQTKGPAATILQKATVFAVSNKNCQLRSGRYPIHDTQMCALNRAGIGACSGDSGGPLVYNNQLVGVVSWVFPCALGYPDVYTKVTQYLGWIQAAQRS